jgi:hypothetical protein
MDQHNDTHHDSPEIEAIKNKDFTHNWVNSSVFLFYLQVFVIVAFVLGGCFSLYKYRYKGKPDVAIPESTQYDPKYK